MARRPRRNNSLAFKAKVAVPAIRGEKPLIKLAQDFDVHPNQIKQWRDQLLEGATGVFGDSLKAETEPVIDVKTRHAKIEDPNFDSAEDILRAWSRGIRPDPDLIVSEWADKHRWLSSRAAAKPGRYRAARMRYLREIMDALSPGYGVDTSCHSRIQAGINRETRRNVGDSSQWPSRKATSIGPYEKAVTS